MMDIRVMCVSDSNRPKEIPEEKWVKKGEKYTINKLMKLMKNGGILGVTLEEIKLDESNLPYKYFKLERFKVLDSDELLLDKIEREVTVKDVEFLEKV